MLFVECVDGADYHEFMQKPARGDCRILEVGLNALGHPERSLREIASMCREVPVKWSLPGPRTAKWCVNYLSVEGLGFDQASGQSGCLVMGHTGALPADHEPSTSLVGRPVGRLQSAVGGNPIQKASNHRVLLQ